MSDYVLHNGELLHYGVKGMKWGVRKFEKKYEELGRKKTEYREAKKAYNKSFNKAYNRAIAAYSPSKKHRDANDKRWNDAAEKAEKLKAAKKEYKDIKKEVRENTTVGQKIGLGVAKVAPVLDKIGKTYLYDQMFNGGRGTEATKNALRIAGVFTVYAAAKARGDTIVEWYDKKGRRII